MKPSSPYHGPSLFTMLGLLFIALKLTGNIDWSWWWVLSPFWGVFILATVAFVVGTLAQDSRARRLRRPYR